MPIFNVGAAGGTTSEEASYNITNSLMLDGGSSTYLNRTPGSTGNRRTFTLSFWVKRTLLAGGTKLYQQRTSSSPGQQQFSISWRANGLRVLDQDFDNELLYDTTAFFRDTSAWYHIVVAVDTTNGTAADRAKFYVNNTRITSFTSPVYYDQNYDTSVNTTDRQLIGVQMPNSSTTLNSHLDAYLSEFVMIDGQQLTPTSFGKVDSASGIWKPIDVSELTFGTNGFYLNFENSSNLGNDANGGTDFTSNNISSINQSLDTPTNNYCTLNPLFRNQTRTNQTNYSIGNTKGAGIGDAMAEGSMLVYGGKWYYEATTLGDTMFGWGQAGKWPGDAPGQSFTDTGSGVGLHSNGRILYKAAYITGASESFNSGTNTVMIAIDFDNQKFYHGKNGNWAHSMNPAGNSGGEGLDSTFWDGVRHGWVPAFRISNGASDYSQVNFGNPLKSISSGNADDNSHGNFEYDVPAGFYALNTKNLAEHGG